MEKEVFERSDKWAELAQTVIDKHPDIQWLRTMNIRIDYVTSSKAKTASGDRSIHAQCKRIDEFHQIYCPYDFVIIFYLPNIGHMNDDQKKILLYHELLHIDYHETKDGEITYCCRPHDIEDFKKIIAEYGMDWAE